MTPHNANSQKELRIVDIADKVVYFAQPESFISNEEGVWVNLNAPVYTSPPAPGMVMIDKLGASYRVRIGNKTIQDGNPTDEHRQVHIT